MKTMKHVWEKFITQENFEVAIINACRGHRNKRDVLKAKANIPELAKRIRALILSGEFKFQKPNPKVIKERGKERVIVRPKFFFDHIVHHAIVQALYDGICDKMHPCSCGSIPGRGTSYAVKRVKRAMMKYKPKYYLQMDIHHFFASVKPKVLMAALSKKIHDHKMLNFLQQLIESTEGLPLGYYTSQWFANFLLTPLDHHISGQDFVSHYTRYMDDMVAFGNNKRKLFQLRADINAILGQMELEVKSNWKLHRFCRDKGMPLNFLGYRFQSNYRDNWATLRHPLFLRLRRKYLRLKRKLPLKAISYNEVCAGMSYYGWLVTSTTHAFMNRIKNFWEMIVTLKRIASNKRREENVAMV